MDKDLLSVAHHELGDGEYRDAAQDNKKRYISQQVFCSELYDQTPGAHGKYADAPKNPPVYQVLLKPVIYRSDDRVYQVRCSQQAEKSKEYRWDNSYQRDGSLDDIDRERSTRQKSNRQACAFQWDMFRALRQFLRSDFGTLSPKLIVGFCFGVKV